LGGPLQKIKLTRENLNPIEDFAQKFEIFLRAGNGFLHCSIAAGSWPMTIV
jgi:hypothetical protein